MKNFKRLAALILLILLAAIAYIIYDNNQPAVQPPAQNAVESLELPVADMSDWKEYLNSRYLFSLKHPPEVTVNVSQLDSAESPETASFFNLTTDLPKDSPEAKNLPNLSFLIEPQEVKETPINPPSAFRTNVTNARRQGAEALARAIWELNRNDPNPDTKDKKSVGNFETKLLNGKQVYLFSVVGSYTTDTEDTLLETKRTYIFTDHKGNIYNFNVPSDDQPSEEVVATIKFID